MYFNIQLIDTSWIGTIRECHLFCIVAFDFKILRVEFIFYILYYYMFNNQMIKIHYFGITVILV